MKYTNALFDSKFCQLILDKNSEKMFFGFYIVQKPEKV